LPQRHLGERHDGRHQRGQVALGTAGKTVEQRPGLEFAHRGFGFGEREGAIFREQANDETIGANPVVRTTLSTQQSQAGS